MERRAPIPGMPGGILLVRCLKHLAPVLCSVDRIIFGTGTTISRMAHAHLMHPGPFEACRRCNGFQWAPAEDRSVLVTGGDGRLVEDSALIRRLLVA